MPRGTKKQRQFNLFVYVILSEFILCLILEMRAHMCPQVRPSMFMWNKSVDRKRARVILLSINMYVCRSILFRLSNCSSQYMAGNIWMFAQTSVLMECSITMIQENENKEVPWKLKILHYGFHTKRNYPTDLISASVPTEVLCMASVQSHSLSLALRLIHWVQEKNGRHFPDDIFRCIFLNENVRIMIKIP